MRNVRITPISWTLSYVFISLIFILSLSACGGSGGGGSSSGTTETATTPSTIQGVLALGNSSTSSRQNDFGNKSGKSLRTISQTEVQLLDATGKVLATVTTDQSGAYSFSEPLDASSYPLRLKTSVGGVTYSSAIVTPSKSATANVNEITTAIDKQLEIKVGQTQNMLNSITSLVMSNRFGVNGSGNTIMPENTFTSGDFNDASSLGNLLLNATLATTVNFLKEAPKSTPYLNNASYLNGFARELRSAANPTVALDSIKSQPGSDGLAQSLEEISAADASQLSALEANLLTTLSDQIAALQDKINELETQIDTLEQTAIDAVASTKMTVTDLTGVTTFTVPPNAISFVLQAFGDPNTVIGFFELTDPSGGNLISDRTWLGDVRNGYGNVLIPKAPGLSATAGEWSFLPSLGFTSIRLTMRTGTLPSKSTLRIKPYLTGTTYSASSVEEALVVVKTIYETAGLKVSIDPLTRISDGQYATVSTDFNDVTTAALVSQGAANRINLFFVEDFSGADAGILGIAAGIPGSLGIAGKHNGVLNGMEAHVRRGVLNTQLLGETAAHEMGHWFGLFHTTESNGLHDPLTDTAECPGPRFSPSACTQYDGTNLMFWQGDGITKQMTLSPQQARIINYSPIAQ